MFRNVVLLLNFWLVSTTEKQPVAEKNQILNQDLEEKQILNRTPLVLTESLGDLHFPKRVRITREHQKQEYYFSKERDGQYYCPIEHTKENEELLEKIEKLRREEFKYCLFKKKNSKKEEPMCKDEVKPLIVQIRGNLGQMTCGSGFLYKFAYEICTPKSVTGKALRWILWKKTPKADLFAYVDHPHLYEICYEHFTDSKERKISGRVLFTEHKIRSPYLFRNLNLYEENAMHKFSDHYSTETYGLDNLKSLNGNLEAFLKQPEKPRPKYELEMLVPSVDFALGHWKKATYHMINYAPLHGWGTYLWRNITAYVSGKLIQLYKKIGPIRIFTGTYGEFEYNRQKVYLGDDPVTRVPIPVIWWKLLYAEDKYPRKAVVVIMHAVKNLPKKCKEETTACDISKWNLNLDHQIYHYIYVYCCNVSNAKDYITTIYQLRIPDLEKIELLELD